MKNYIQVFLLLISLNLYAQESLYISPGLTFGLNQTGSLSIGWKVSFGYYVEENYYLNITYGQNNLSSSNTDRDYDYSYLEFQGGDFFEYYPLSASAGIGVTFLGDKIYPKISLSAGALLFLHANYTFNKNLFDLGGNIVLPIAFKKEYRDLNPG